MLIFGLYIYIFLIDGTTIHHIVFTDIVIFYFETWLLQNPSEMLCLFQLTLLMPLTIFFSFAKRLLFCSSESSKTFK